MKNSSFVEFLIFFCFVAFIAAMMNMEVDLEGVSSGADADNKDNMYNLFEQQVQWEDRLDRLSPVGTVEHDSKPETNLFGIVLTATYQDVNNDDLIYAWEHLSSWDNSDSRESFDTPITFTPNNSLSKVECEVVAGIHEFQVTVTDTYGEESKEVVTIEVGSEQNVAPNGRVSVVKRVPGCMDNKANNFNANANSDDGGCEYWGCTDSSATNYDADANVDDGSCTYPPADPFKGDVDAIKEWQTNNGLEADGMWGPKSQEIYDALKNQSEDDGNKEEVKEAEEEVNEAEEN